MATSLSRPWQSIPYKWLVAAVFVAGLFMDLLDSSIVNVALPTLGRQFHAGDTTLEWVVTAYLLSLAVWIPASGWLGDRFGTKRVFLFALAMFTLGSALCGLAWSIDSLIAFRVLQGIGGGMLTPVGTAMLFRAFPPEERATASGVLIAPIAIAPALGPVLGGVLVDDASWRWIFDVNVPIGLLSFVLGLTVLREHTEAQAGRFDLFGLLLSGTGLPLALYALARAPHAGWLAPVVLATGLAGLALLVGFVLVELRRPAPLLDLRLLGDRLFRSGNIVWFLVTAAFLGVLFLLPLYLQQLRGLSALQSGLTTFPQALGIVAATGLASRLYPRVGPRRLLAVGLAGVAITTAPLAWVGLATGLWWLRGLMFVRGLAFAFALVPLQTATFTSITPARMGRASAFFNTNRQVASSVGVALVATVLTSRVATHVAQAVHAAPPAMRLTAARHGTLLAYHDAFLVTALLAVAGLASIFLVRDTDAAASMVLAAEQGAPQVGPAD